MITLDMQTVMFANVIINAVCLIVLLMLWYQNHRRYSGLSFWVLDWVLLTAGTLLITLQGSIPSWSSMLLSNSMLIGGTFVLCFGLARFTGKKHNPIIISSVFVVLVAFIAVQSYFIYVHNDLTVRNYNVAIGLLLAFALGTWLMFKGVSPEIRRISKSTGIAFAILAFISFLRIMGFTLIPQTGNQFLQSGKFDTLFVALLVGATAFLAFNLVLMVNKRLYIEEKQTEEKNVYLASFPETNTSPIAELDIEGNLRYQNPACKHIFPDLATLGLNHPFFVSWTEAVKTLQKVNAVQPVIHEVTVNNLVYEQAYFAIGNDQIRIYTRDITKRKKAEEKLVDSEARYRRLFESVQDAILILNGDTGQIIDANPFIKDLLGYSMEELVGKNLWEIGSLKDTLASKISYRQLYETGYVRYHNLPLITKDGRQIDVEVVANAYPVDHKRIIQCNIRDMTKSKRMEEVLKASEVRYRRLFEAARDGILILNVATGIIIDVNPFMIELLGFSRGEFLDKKIWELGIFKDIIPNQDNFEELKRNKYITYENMPLETATGRRIQVEFVSYLYEVGSQQVIQCNIRDITERKFMEEALRMSETNFRTSMDDSPLGICIVKRDGTTIYANRKFLDMCGYANLEEYLSTLPEERYTPEGYQWYLERREKRNNGDVADYNYQTSIIRKDGKIRYLEVFSKIILWGGKPHYQVLNIDIAERIFAENALKASEERFRRLAENIPDIISRFSFVPSRGYEYVSPASKVVTGYTPEEYYANPELGSEMIYPPDRELQQSMANKPELYKGTPLITRYIRKDGMLVWVERRQIPIYSDDGKLIALEGIDRDVTEDIRMEEALRMSENNFRNSMDDSPLGVRVVSPDGETFYTNHKFLDIYGYENLSEFRSKPVKERYTAESYQEHLARRDARQRGEHVLENYEINIVRKDGSIRQLEVFRKNVLWGGEPQFLMLYNDVTEHKRVEEALKASEENYRTSIDNSPLGIRISDIDNNSLYFNQTFLDTFGYNNIDEVRAKPPQRYYTPECYAEYLKMRDALRRGEKMQDQVDIDIMRKDGTIRHVQALFKEVLWNGKKQYQTIYNDITDRKNTEKVTREMEVMKKVDRLRSDLLANVSHELRTPLAAIKGYASTLLRKDVKWSAKQQQDFLKIIDSETDRLIRLINDILDVSRIDGGALKIRQQQCQVSNIVESMKSRLKVLTKNHKLAIDIPKTLPAVYVDEMRIGQVISNLVDNAVKFSPAGSEISITANRNEDKVTINVTDHGEGMTEEVMSKLFNRFYQAENVASGRQKGTGLGLVICRGIIESHGGVIWVESKLGAGSKFSFSLPLWKEESNG